MLWELIGRLANNCLTFRISGEPGVGKEAIAHLIHRHYPHKGSKFVKINCRELQDATNASPFTDTPPPSVTTLKATIDKSENQVIYFENIHLLPKAYQTQLQELLNKTYSTASPWIFASSIAPLENFNGDTVTPSLFKALDAVHIAVPPLRHHTDKIPQILSWFLHAFSRKTPKTMAVMPKPHVMDRLLSYRWPGNLRQLQQVAWKAFSTSDWERTAECLDVPLKDNLSLAVDEIAAIYLMSLAKLSIHKEKIIEVFMDSSKMEEVGLLDLAIYHEAVSQIADHIDSQENVSNQDHLTDPVEGHYPNPRETR